MSTTAIDETAAVAQLDEIDAILSRVQSLKAQQRILEAELSDAVATLTDALDAGAIDPAFSFNDWSFSFSQGRLTTSYSDDAKAAIKRIQETDVTLGHAVQKRGAGFWTIKPPAI